MSERNVEVKTNGVGKATVAERRRAARHRCNLKASCRLFGRAPDETIPAVVQDLSAAGIRLIVGESLPKGAILEITFHRRSSEIASTPHLVRIRRASQQPEGDWLIGCTFVKNRSDEEMSKFLSWSDRYETKATSQQAAENDQPDADPFLLGSTKERRKASRRRGSAVTVQAIQPHLTPMPLEGWVVDRSCIGICISLAHLFPKGVKLKIRPVKSGQGGSWSQAVVKSCRQAGNRWLLGCQWTTDMPVYALQLFG